MNDLPGLECSFCQAIDNLDWIAIFLASKLLTQFFLTSTVRFWYYWGVLTKNWGGQIIKGDKEIEKSLRKWLFMVKTNAKAHFQSLDMKSG